MALNAGTFAPHPAPSATSSDSRYFAETQHSIAFGFKAYWEGLAKSAGVDGATLLGAPLSDEMTEDGQTVQYFERGRLELRDDKATLSTVGDLYLASAGWPRPLKAALNVTLPKTDTPNTVAQGKVFDVAFRSTTLAQKQPLPQGAFGDSPFTFVADSTTKDSATAMAAVPSDAKAGARILRGGLDGQRRTQPHY